MSSEQLPEEKNGDWVDLKKEDLSCTLPTHSSTVTDTTAPSSLTENSTQEENTENSEEEPTEKSTEEENSNLATLSITEVATIENLKIAEKTPSTPSNEPTESTPVEPSDAVVPATVKTEEQTLEKKEEKEVPATLTEEQTLEVKDVVEDVPATLTQEQTLEVKDVVEDVPATIIEDEQTLDEPETLLRERRTKDSAETSTAENIRDEESTPRTTPQANPVDKVANFFLTPGITSSAVVIMNASFAGLFLSLFVLLAMTHSYHVVFLIFTTAGLFISTHWFMMELKAAKAREAIWIASETSECEVSVNLERTKEHIQSESKLSINETRAKQA